MYAPFSLPGFGDAETDRGTQMARHCPCNGTLRRCVRHLHSNRFEQGVNLFVAPSFRKKRLSEIHLTCCNN
jgi:hypothetical protein